MSCPPTREGAGSDYWRVNPNQIERIRAIYPWQGEVHDTYEARVAVRTRIALVDAIIERTRAEPLTSCPASSRGRSSPRTWTTPNGSATRPPRRYRHLEPDPTRIYVVRQRRQ